MNSDESLNEQTLKGGRGECPQCGEWHNNVSYHEAHECVPSDDADTTPTENFTDRMMKPTLDEVQTQMEAWPKRERAIEMLKDIIKEVDYDAYKGLFVNPEEPEYAEEKIEALIQIVQSYQR